MEIKDIKELMRLFDKSGLTEFEIEKEDERIFFSKNTPFNPAMFATAPHYMNTYGMAQHATNTIGATINAHAPAEEIVEESGNKIESPMVGTYYSAPSPGSSPFVKVGDIVEKGQTLCIIEAMKIMNTIEAEYRCKILKILSENGLPVEYGQEMFLVEPL